jgi:hypothetical protein
MAKISRNSVVTMTTPDGETLWCVHYMSSYEDNDPRMPGTVPVDVWVYVLAKTRDDAIKKAQPTIKQQRGRKDRGAGEEVVAMPMSLENLVPCRISSEDGRLGFRSTVPFKQVTLSRPVDSKRYRIGVVLIPL